MLGNETNYVFQGDSTYYISGVLDLLGTNTFESGTVIKYTNGASINIMSGAAVNWISGPYHPVIFTGKDDNTVSETISGSTGNPNTNYYANPALDFSGTNISTISNIRISYARVGVLTASGNAAPALYNDQFVHCQYAAQFNGSTAYLRNILFDNVQTNFFNLAITNIDLQNVTFNNSNNATALASVLSGTPNLFLTNCILANVGSYGPVSTNGGYNGFYNSKEFGANAVTNTFYPFQTVGAAGSYLTNGCNFHT